RPTARHGEDPHSPRAHEAPRAARRGCEPMTHDELRELLAVHALDALDPADRAELETHLVSCPTCPTELTRLREAAGLIGLEEAPVTPPAALRTRILERVASGPTRGAVIQPDPGIWRRFAIAGGLAAAAAIVALVTYASGLATRMHSIEGDL